MRLALAIASYNGDPAAASLAALASAKAFDDAFVAAAVIDSGDPDSCARLRASVGELSGGIEYHWFEGNLGAAGNLCRRLSWAREHGADALLALNADGRLDLHLLEPMRRLIEHPAVAAVYPVAVLADGTVDLSYLHAVPLFPSRRPETNLPHGQALRVRWGSSNGAMYRLDWLERLDLGSVEALWHGWEDLALGTCMHAVGGQQLLALDARSPTSSDQRRWGRSGPVVSDKAPWTTYYTIRNLLLLLRMRPSLFIRVLLRIQREMVMIVTRDHRGHRYRLAWRGLLDGLRGRSGQVVDPAA